METVYFYTTDKKQVGRVTKYTVIKSTAKTVYHADEKAKSYAADIGKKLAGGYFTSSAIPYNFKEDYKVINLPKNYRAKKRPASIVDSIMAYEMGELTESQIINLFQELVNTGQAWQLQGHYGRTAKALLDAGYINPPKKKTKENSADYYGNRIW